jgi:ribosomal protein S18 acetylase RimI-like enzyme
MANLTYATRAAVDLGELQALFARAWDGSGKPDYDRVLSRSFTWVTAHDDERLVGFVNIAWDGGVHFFMLDTTVDPAYQRQGIGTELVRRAIDACRGHGEWMHVDSDDELMERLYFAVGFAPATAGTVGVAH